MDGADPALAWWPIAASEDLPLRHTYQGKLLGRELAVWRADDGYVNVWEDHCLHRGVRLSIGLNDGSELKCQYHGWRYASRSAGCTYIPAHPADAPARTICCTTLPVAERYGLVWSGEEPPAGGPELEGVDDDVLALRAVVVHAPKALVAERLVAEGAQSVGQALELDGAVFVLQPVDAAVAVIRGLVGRPPDSDVMATLRRHNSMLTRLRDELEAVALTRPPPPPMVPRRRNAPAVPVVPPTHTAADTRLAPLRVVVARKWFTAEGVAAFELTSIGGPLPAFQPGAHIDVHLPNGLVRQYSLTNGPGEVTSWRIGVKLEPDSAGGSRSLHETVREGDVLAVSDPRCNFPLRRDRLDTVLVAGGIGITPLLAMAQSLAHAGLGFTLHCFAQSEGHVAFGEVLATLGDRVRHHLGLSPDETTARLRDILATPAPASQLYVCGPAPMLGATRQIAAELGWPAEDVHFEYFKNPSVIDDSSTFTVELARSALDVDVGAGVSVLEALAERGIVVPSSCQQGACGTCLVGVLAGVPDHQDVYLNDAEKARNDRMLVCISRAKTPRLVLDV
jgi:ferredoxin-NADP reductase/nitrite reductase/ring-hydroxylating ferredoxin subunit